MEKEIKKLKRVVFGGALMLCGCVIGGVSILIESELSGSFSLIYFLMGLVLVVWNIY